MNPVAARPDVAFDGSGPATEIDQARVVGSLRNPAAFGPQCQSVEVIETHISYVFLTGHYAYKVKKAIRLPFLDFTTLASRRRYCEVEVALNRRTAPALYIDVVPIVESEGRFVAGGFGEAVEWAVRMRQFPAEALLSKMIERGTLTARHVDRLAERVAAFHQSIDGRGPGTAYGTPREVLRLALDNFDQIMPLIDRPVERARIAVLRTWTLREHAKHQPLMDARRRDGFVRECHGDLHLRNVALLNGDPTPFDCIEFDPRLRWSDVMADVAFTAMDLRARGRTDFARRFLNRYLEATGDYGGVPVLRFHIVYRAIVRAKVAYLRSAQALGNADADVHRQKGLFHLELAEQLTRRGPRTIIAMHGFAGCGKTTLSQALIEHADVVRIRMDVERKRMEGLAVTARTGSGIDAGLYAPDRSRAIYDHVAALTAVTLNAGESIVVDAAFLKRWQRDLFRSVAQRCGARFLILALAAPDAVLRERVATRSAYGRDASEADVRVLENQLATHDPLATDEQPSFILFSADLAAILSSERWRTLVASLCTQPSADAAPMKQKTVPAIGIREKVAFLSRASSYTRPTSRVDVVETHLSWVFLTDAHAFKLKKPVRLEGLDYRTLDARHRNTAEEIRLNRRLATSVYQSAVRLVARNDRTLVLDEEGETVDWLVKMRRLPADRMLDALIRTRRLRDNDIAAVVVVLMRLYRQAIVASMSADEYRRRLQATVGATHEALSRTDYGLPREDVNFVSMSLLRYLDRERELLASRVRRGAIVDGHGDLRPEHVCIEDEPQIIDCLEFSQDLRIQDCADELAFLALECERLGAPALRQTIFESYAALADDAVPPMLVDFYQSHRAYVRAKLAARHLDDARVRDPERWRRQALDYLRLARAHLVRCQ